MSSTVAVCGRLTVFEIAPEMNGWTAPIILMWPMCEIARSPTATSNTGRCSSARPGAPTIVLVLVDVRLDLLDLLVGVAERLQRQRHRAVDDRHLPAADQLLELDEREVGLDAGRVAVHQERDRPRRREHRRLRVAVAVLVAELDRLVPRAARRASSGVVGARRVRDRVRGVAVHPHHVVVRLAVLRVALVRADRRGDLGRAAVRAAGHQRGDRRRRAAARVGVVRHAVAHQEGAEVRVAEAELAERARVLRDPLGRVARRADDDLLREEDDVDRVLEARRRRTCRRRCGTS